LAETSSDDDNSDDNLLHEALEAFQVDWEYWQPEYLRMESDIDFSLGDQWPDVVKNQRMLDGRPCLTENRIDVSCIQVVNDIRQTRPAINVTPQDDTADVETAKILKGIVRNIEQQSNANNAYDTAVENSVRGGIGWIRVNTKYVDEASFDQDICIEAVENPFSVLLDSASRKLDGSDARRAFVFVDMPKDTFEALYPDAAPLSFDPDLEQKNWYSRSSNIVRVAEYFYKDEKKTKLYNTSVGALTAEQCKELGIPTEGLPERESTVTTIKWCKFNAQEILEKTEWVGKYIPIVPVYGKVVWSEGRRKSFSLTYQGRDPQMRYNIQLTAETEWTAMQPKAPWVAYDDQLTPAQAEQFSQSNVKNFAVLYHKKTYDKNDKLLPPPQRQPPPSGSPALMQQSQMAKDGIQATLGIFDASLGAAGNETSGRAIMARQSEGDNATFHFVDNLATSIRQVGIINVDLIPKVISTRQAARILGDDNEPSMVPLNQPVIQRGKKWVADPMGDKVIKLDAGKYDVSVSIGPSFATKRIEMTQTMTELFRAMPEMMKYAGDIYFRNSDFDGAQELAERAKMLLPPELKEDKPEQALLKKAQDQIQAMGQQLQQLDAKLKEKQDNQAFSNDLEMRKLDLQRDIDNQKLELERDRLKLETLKAQGDMTPEQTNAMLAAITDMHDNLMDVGQAVDALITAKEQEIQAQQMGMNPETSAQEPAVEIPQGAMLE